MQEEALISIENVTRCYHMGDNKIMALAGISLIIEEGEFVAVMGPSGSGKSTLMNLLGCLDKPTSGRIRINKRYTEDLNPKELARLRNAEVGFVFQQFNLLPKLTLVDNVATPLMYSGVSPSERRIRAVQALSEVDLGNRLKHRPNELSGGQKQRVAVARALINDPAILLADEPTGALDSKTGDKIMGLFREINAGGKTVIIVTHDPDIAAICERIIWLKDGKVVGK
jgi:putative ABC transport system ATP-binding protein